MEYNVRVHEGVGGVGLGGGMWSRMMCRGEGGGSTGRFSAEHSTNLQIIALFLCLYET